MYKYSRIINIVSAMSDVPGCPSAMNMTSLSSNDVGSASEVGGGGTHASDIGREGRGGGGVHVVEHYMEHVKMT